MKWVYLIIGTTIFICTACGRNRTHSSPIASIRGKSNFEPSWLLHIIDNSSRGADGVRLADVNNDGLADITTGFEQGGITRAYLHPGYDEVEKQWPADTKWIQHDISGDELGIKYDRIELLDLDNDGDLDVLTCEEAEGAGGLGVIWYENPCE